MYWGLFGIILISFRNILVTLEYDDQSMACLSHNIFNLVLFLSGILFLREAVCVRMLEDTHGPNG